MVDRSRRQAAVRSVVGVDQKDEQFEADVVDLSVLDLETFDSDRPGSTNVIDLRDHREYSLPEPSELTRLSAFGKRSFDVSVALFSLLIMAPVLLVTVIAIRVTSSGPAFYSQERYGRGGKPFRMLKFRSMVVDADQRLDEMAQLAQTGDVSVTDAPAFKSAEDPRITRLGAWLRRSNLDEFPQLINVLLGEMSLVGPRPLVPDEVEWLPSAVAELRHSVRPGLTCIWQVKRQADTSFRDRIEFDLDYVRRQSVGLDLMLFVLTPVAVLRGAGSH